MPDPRVLFLIDSLGSGGAERSTAVMLPFLRERGIDASVVTLYRAGEGNEDVVRGAGFAVTILRHQHFIGRVRELRALIRTQRPDVLHTALFAADQLGRIASIGTPVSVVTSLVNVPLSQRPSAGGGPASWKLRVVGWIDRITGRLFVDRFHAVSPGVAAAYTDAQGVSAARIETIERGRSRAELGVASTARRQAVRAALDLTDDDQVIFTAGRHDQQKAHDDLVQAFMHVAADHPRAVLLIAGREGETTPRLHQLLADHPEHADRVRLLGFRPDVADLLAASDVMALSSRFEGTAGVVLEAMALHVPVVSTDLGGLQGILHDGQNSLLSAVGDTRALADNLRRVIDDPALATTLADRGLEQFDARFTIEGVADRMAAFYRSLAKR